MNILCKLSKTIALALMMIASGYIYAQDPAIQILPGPPKKLSIGASYSPDFCYRTLIYTGDDHSANAALRGLHQMDRPKFGYTSGVVINYAIKKNMAIESGILFSDKGFKSRHPVSNLRFPDQIDPDSGFVKPTAEPIDVEEMIIERNFMYIDIPVRLVCSMNLKKFKIISSCGLVTNVLLKATETVTKKYKDGHKEKGSPAVNFLYTYNPVCLSAMLSAGIEYNIGPAMTMRVEPTLRHGILSIENAPVKCYLWNAGLNVGCYWGIR